MRLKFAIRLLSSAALAAILSLGALGGANAEDAAKKDEAGTSAIFDPDTVNTFAGALLAARTADVDHDYETAIALYKKALQIEPGNPEIRQRLMISLLLNGDIKDSVKYANDLKNDPTIERLATIVRGADAIRRGEYKTAETALRTSGPTDLDRVMNDLMAAWARQGAGKGKEALTQVEKMKGPDWLGIFQAYNAGAIAIVNGDVRSARRHLNDAVLDKDGAATAPDTFMRAVIALARLEATQGNKQKALDTISVGDNLLPNYAPLNALRQSITNDEKQRQQVETAKQGAAGVLFSFAGALNRDGAEDIVSLYLQIAKSLDPDSADALVMLGGIAEKQNQLDRAIAIYKQVPDNSPMSRISELQLGLALAEGGKVEEARKHLQGLIASDPKDIRSYLAYGSVLSDAKDYAAMAENYDKAVEVIGPLPGKNTWTVFFQRGIAYERLKQWDKAEPATPGST
jgi:tetratricopeptide (TPR) repeat protein